MLDGLTTGIIAGSIALAALGLIAMLIKKPLGVGYLASAAIIELAVLVQVIAAVVGLVRGATVEGVALFVAYLVFALIVLPAGTLWAVGEKNRWSGAVLAVAALALVVTFVRIDAVWIAGPHD